MDRRRARGRTIVLAAIVVALLFAAADLLIAPLTRPDWWISTLIRLGLTGLLLFAMWRGRAWARLLFLVLLMVGMAFAGAILMEPPAAAPVVSVYYAIGTLVIGALLVWFLAFDKSVIAWEQWQQDRYPRLFGPEVR